MLARALPALLLAVALAAGCDKTTHDNIDKWMKLESGPTKLKKALSDDSLDAELAAHAGANLVKKGLDPDVISALDGMSPSRRVAVLALLAPRLWELARVQGEMTMPDPQQVAAKDALVAVRKYGDAAVKATIDGYLVDWYTSGFYEGRATLGVNQGAAVMRLLGPQAGKKLIAAADAVAEAPPHGTQRVKIGDEILLGLAASCSPDAARRELEIARLDRGDPSLSTRAVSALYKGYVNSQQLFEVCDPAGLKPNLDALISIAKDDNLPHEVTNDAVSLIRVTGAPACLAPLVSMVAAAHRDVSYRYVGANAALKCGGVAAIPEVVRALPDGAYQHDEIAGAVWTEIAHMLPRDQVVAALRPLLADKSRTTRWVAIEGLAALNSIEDAPRISTMAHDAERLTGYWGPDAGKPDPTLGQRATELAAQLNAPAK